MYKFAVKDFKGGSKCYLSFTPATYSTKEIPKQKHHIIIVDRSGSMSPYMRDVKDTLKKIFTLHEYNDPSMLISLMSYSSKGDLTIHFTQKTLSEINASDVDKLYATYTTCISQSLFAIKNLIKPNQITGVTLHSDGYANDPSSFDERNYIFKACDELKTENLFINTISHSRYSDYQLLSSIANKMSGKCVQANSIREVFDSITNTFDSIKSDKLVSSEIDMSGHDYLLYVSPLDSKIIGSSTNINLSMLNDPDSKMFFVDQMDADSYEKSTDRIPIGNTILHALARAYLSEGNINMSKYLISSLGDKKLFDKYWNASSSEDISKFALELENVAFSNKAQTFTGVAITIDDSVTVLDILDKMSENPGSANLILDMFMKDYKRIGVKKLQGSRDDNGILVEPWLETQSLGDKNLVPIVGIDISTTSANISLKTAKECRLVNKADKTPITNVAGISVASLTIYNNYAIIANGELSTTTIPIMINDKNLFESLKAYNVLFEGDQKAVDYDYAKVYIVKLDGLPVTKLTTGKKDVKKSISDLFIGKIIISLLESALKESSESYDDKQIEELKKHYLSKSLNINFPTTNPYTDLDEAIRTGVIDTRSSYKIKYGTEEIFGSDSFRSANEFIKRIYEPEDDSKEYDCTKLLEAISWKEKVLSARSKNSVADIFQKRVLDSILMRRMDQSVEILLTNSGCNELLFSIKNDTFKTLSKDERINLLSNSKKILSKYMDRIYVENIFQYVIYMGSFGIAPDDWDAKAILAEDVKKLWPEVKISKNEQNGLFYKAGDCVFGINSENTYVSL